MGWRLRALFRKRAFDADMDDELRFHLELQIQENIQSGLSAEEARYAALRSLGGMEQVKERCRELRGVPWLEHLAQDVRFGLRLLAKAPGFTAVALTTLALGVGATTAAYSLVHNSLLDPFSFPDADRVLWVESSSATENVKATGVNPVVLAAMLAAPQVFGEVAWNVQHHLRWRRDEFADVLIGEEVSRNFFSFWHGRPLLGRTFAPDEGKPGGERVLVLSHRCWQTQFGGEAALVGKTLNFEGQFATVIGVMPPYFTFPGASVSYWTPGEAPAVETASEDPRGFQYWARNHQAACRLPAGVVAQGAQAALAAIAQRHTQVQSLFNEGWRLQAHPLREWFLPPELRRSLWTLLGVVASVLGIVCANLANLTLARVEARRHELAVRAALGATRGRLVRQLFIESLLLALAGGGLGLLFTHGSLRVLEVLFTPTVRFQPVATAWGLFGWAMSIAWLVAIAVGSWPAWRGSKLEVHEAIKQTSGGTTATRPARWMSHGLVAAEVAAAMVLLAGAGLMVQTVIRLLRVDPGFEPGRLVRVSVDPPWQKYQREGNFRLLCRRLQEGFAALPGVKSVGLGISPHQDRPYAIDEKGGTFRLWRAGCGVGEADLFQTLGVPVLEGRRLESQDLKQNRVVVNEALARAVWPGQKAVGKRFKGLKQRDWTDEPVFEVVGVVGDYRVISPAVPPPPTYFLPAEGERAPGPVPVFYVRTQGAPQGLLRALGKTIKEIEPDMARPRLALVQQTLWDKTQRERQYMYYLLGFAGLGVFLAVLGVYSLLAHAVRRRTRELGIRLALGAQRREVIAMVWRQGLRVTMAGVGLGFAGALLATRLLRSLLYGISPGDPATLGAVALLLLGVAAVAAWLPARRAAKIDPMVALRYE
jgi:predicted permease